MLWENMQESFPAPSRKLSTFGRTNMNIPKGFCSIHRNLSLCPYAKGPKNLCMMIMKVGEIAFGASEALKESFSSFSSFSYENLRILPLKSYCQVLTHGI